MTNPFPKHIWLKSKDNYTPEDKEELIEWARAEIEEYYKFIDELKK